MLAEHVVMELDSPADARSVLEFAVADAVTAHADLAHAEPLQPGETQAWVPASL